MLRQLSRAAALVLVFAFADSAHALLELKFGLAQLSPNPTALNDFVGASAGGPAIGSQSGFVLDAMADPPGIPFQLGVRYESYSQAGGDGGTANGGMQAKYARTSVVLGKRLINTIAYLGPIATVSYLSDFNYDFTKNNAKNSYTAGGKTTASVGVEAGLRLLLLRIGAEAGYLYAPLGTLKDATGAEAKNSAGSTMDVDYSGVYARVLLGFGF